MAGAGSLIALRAPESVRSPESAGAGGEAPPRPVLELASMAVAAVLAIAWALWQPPVRDLAGQLLRVEQYEALGPHVWSNVWYGGHHTPGYSALFAPLAATLGIGVTGVLAATAAAGCFAALLRRLAGRAAWAGALWFAAATVTNLLTGRLPFALGTALALAACLAAQRRRPVAAAVLAVATGATSGVAAAFVTIAGVAVAVAGPTARRRRDGLVLAGAATATVIVIGLAFPVGGDALFGPVRLAAAVASGLAVFAAATAADRVVRAGGLLYAAACVAVFAIPSPLGGTVGRLGALVAGPLVLTLLVRRRRDGTLPRALERPGGRAVLLVAAVAALCWQWGAARVDVHDALAAPYAASTQRGFYDPVVTEIRRRSPGPVRVEIPLTATHYEARWVAPRVALARGWLRQLDRAHNALFYEGRLTAARYGRWLRDNGITWVAAPSTPLDPSARAEMRVIRSTPRHLRPVWRSAGWRLLRVTGTPGLLSGPGRLQRVGGDSFALWADRPGAFLVRLRHTRLWRVTAGTACVGRSPQGWTAVRVSRPGRVEVRARVGPLPWLGRPPRCRAATRR